MLKNAFCPKIHNYANCLIKNFNSYCLIMLEILRLCNNSIVL